MPTMIFTREHAKLLLNTMEFDKLLQSPQEMDEVEKEYPGLLEACHALKDFSEGVGV